MTAAVHPLTPLDGGALARLAEGAGALRTGLDALDRAEALRAGALTVVAGRESAAVTALLEHLVLHVAASGTKVSWFSLVDPPLEVARRVVGRLSGAPRNAGAPSPDAVAAAWAALSDMPLRAYLRASLDAWELADAARSDGARLVVVHALAALRPLPGDGDDRARTVAALRALALESGVAVVAVGGVPARADAPPPAPWEVTPSAASACDALALVDVPALRASPRSVPPFPSLHVYVDGRLVPLVWDVARDLVLSVAPS